MKSVEIFSLPPRLQDRIWAQRDLDMCPICWEKAALPTVRADLPSQPESGEIYARYRCLDCGSMWTAVWERRKYIDVEFDLATLRRREYEMEEDEKETAWMRRTIR